MKVQERDARDEEDGQGRERTDFGEDIKLEKWESSFEWRDKGDRN